MSMPSSSQREVVALKAQLSERSVEIEHLKLLIAKLKKQQYGRKSEKLDRQIEQLEFKLEELQTDAGAAALNTPRTGAGTPARDPPPAREAGLLWM
jgi:transposase